MPVTVDCLQGGGVRASCKDAATALATRSSMEMSSAGGSVRGGSLSPSLLDPGPSATDIVAIGSD